MEMDVGMQPQELLDPARLVGGEVVEDDADLAAPWVGRHHDGQEHNKLLAGMFVGGAAPDLAGPSVACCIARERAVAHLLEAAPLGAPGDTGRIRVTPIRRLDMGFLVEAEDDRLLRRG